jgi:hypothetical protein
MHTLLSTVMTTSKKKKSSTSLRVSRPYSLHARTVRLHRNDDNRPALSMTFVPIVSAGLVETPLSKHPESDNSESFSEYIETQADIQHNNPGEANTEGQDSEKPKQRKSTKLRIMEEWLSCRDSYLRELLRHDGRGEHDATSCADCGNSGDFSCFDCAYGMHYCQECLVDHHRLMPLHRISVCNLISSTIWHLSI